MTRLTLALLVALALVACTARPPGESVGARAQLPEGTPTPTSRWYGPGMATAMAAVQTPCPSIPAGCFGHPPECQVDLCYCVRVCEPHLWLPAPGHTDSASGVWAGRTAACVCREE